MYLQSKSDAFFSFKKEMEGRERKYMDWAYQSGKYHTWWVQKMLSLKTVNYLCVLKSYAKEKSRCPQHLSSLYNTFLSLFDTLFYLSIWYVSLSTLPVTDWKCYFFQINSLQVTVESSDYKFKEGERVQNKTFSFFLLSFLLFFSSYLFFFLFSSIPDSSFFLVSKTLNLHFLSLPQLIEWGSRLYKHTYEKEREEKREEGRNTVERTWKKLYQREREWERENE